jgi:hypothetical protein
MVPKSVLQEKHSSQHLLVEIPVVKSSYEVVDFKRLCEFLGEAENWPVATPATYARIGEY